MEPLVDEHDSSSQPTLLTVERMDRALERARLDRAVGSDGVPNELYEALFVARKALYDLVRLLWELVYCPADFVTVLFAMLYKGRVKGPAWKRAAYRSVGLLNHACKILSALLLEDVRNETELFQLPDQDGFRWERGCRGAVLRVQLFIQRVVGFGLHGTLGLLDYSAAFDCSLHRRLDSSLKNAGASNHSRLMFRALYEVANGMVKVRTVAGETLLTDRFPINIGNIQGDIYSPWGFINLTSDVCQAADGDKLDLDFDIRLQCNRLLSLQRTRQWHDAPADAVDAAAWSLSAKAHADADLSSGSDSDGGFAAGGFAAGGFAAGPATDWNDKPAAFREEWRKLTIRGGRALLEAGAPLREKIGEERVLSMAQEQEGASLRPARWTAEWKRERETADSDTAVHSLERKLLLTRLPAGTVPRCNICDAAWPGPFCDDCVDCGLGRVPDPLAQWMSDHRAARARRRDRLAEDLGSSSDSDDGTPSQLGQGTREDGTRFSARLQSRDTSQSRTAYKESDSSQSESGDDAGSGTPATEPQALSPPTRGGRGRGRGRGRRIVRRPVGRGRGAGTRGFRVIFADDTTVGETGPDGGVSRVSQRCTSIRDGSAAAGLLMNLTKNQGLVVRPQDTVGPTTAADVRALNLKYECVCHETWETKHGLLRHQASCKLALETFEVDDDGDVNHDVEALLEVRGPPERRFWRVKWAESA